MSLHLGIFGHVTFLVVFWLLDYPVLAAYNVFSVAAFTYGYWRVFKGDTVTATYLCILFEIPVHLVLATYYLGFNSGFWLLSFISVAIVAICPFFTRFTRFVIASFNLPLLGVVAFFTLGQEPVYEVSYLTSFFFLMMNVLLMTAVIAAILIAYDVAVSNAEAAFEREFDRAETLLHNILPVPIAERLKAGEEPLADNLDAVTVLFSDIAGFTQMSRGMGANELVGLLNDLFTRFDALVAKHGAEKIKTIGDTYMIATGLDRNEKHAEQMINLAQEMHVTFEDFRQRHGLDLGLRTGIHSGKAIAGVIGKQKFAFDLWGDTVNVASRMEASGVSDQIQMTSETRNMLPDHYQVATRGMIEIKGHAARETYLLQ